MVRSTRKRKLAATASAADATGTTRSVRPRQRFFSRRQPEPRAVEQSPQAGQDPPIHKEEPPQSQQEPQEPPQSPAPKRRNMERQVATRNVLQDNNNNSNETSSNKAAAASAVYYEHLGTRAWKNMGRTRGGDGLQYLKISDPNNNDDHSPTDVFHFGRTNTKKTVEQLVEGVTKFTGYEALGKCYKRFGREGLLERAAHAAPCNSSHSKVAAAVGVPLQPSLTVVGSSSNAMPSQKRQQTWESEQKQKEEFRAVPTAPMKNEPPDAVVVSVQQQQKATSELAAAKAPTTAQVLGAVSGATIHTTSPTSSEGLGFRNHLAASLAYTHQPDPTGQRRQTRASSKATNVTQNQTESKMTLLAAVQASAWCNEAMADYESNGNNDDAGSQTSLSFGRDTSHSNNDQQKPPTVVKDTLKQSIAKLEQEIFGEACASALASDLMTRLKRVEQTVLGQESSGGMIPRIQNLQRLVGIVQE